MAKSDQPARRSASHGPTGRGDSTRPAGRLPGGDRRPYPTAATTTRVSPAKPGSTTSRARSHGSAATPTPATVWTAGATGIELDTPWPAPLVAKVVAAFSAPGGRVVLLPWPSTHPTPDTVGARRRGLGVVDADGIIRHAPEVVPGDADDAGLSAALDAVEHLARHGRVVRVAAPDDANRPVSRPFWADLVGDPAPPPAEVSAASAHGIDTVSPDADLVITSLPPTDSGDRVGDLVALVAARLLRVGGILAVLTHSDCRGGELVDPTGAVVAAAQNADLLYLQHIVALHTPVRGGRLATEELPDTNGTAADAQARMQHRAAVRGLPAPHARVHSDVLVFAQPHDHNPRPLSPAQQAPENGVAR